MVFRLGKELVFPDPRLADDDGLIAVGGDLSPERVLLAYTKGIFPWFSKGYPIMWWSPNPRLVLFPGNFKISSSLRHTLKSQKFTVTRNQSFGKVISQCAKVTREDQDGTWITSGMIKAYRAIHALGYAHSFETWQDGKLAGGLYGVATSKLFCGESMFHLQTDASKVALVALVEWVKENGYQLIDCQMTTQHLLSMGATEISREDYLGLISLALGE